MERKYSQNRNLEHILRRKTSSFSSKQMNKYRYVCSYKYVLCSYGMLASVAATYYVKGGQVGTVRHLEN